MIDFEGEYEDDAEHGHDLYEEFDRNFRDEDDDDDDDDFTTMVMRFSMMLMLILLLLLPFRLVVGMLRVHHRD